VDITGILDFAGFVSGSLRSRVRFPVCGKRAGEHMPVTDPIGDYLTRIRNAIQARHKRVDVPASSLKREITRILIEQGFVSGVSDVPTAIATEGKQRHNQNFLRIQLRYVDGQSAITGLKRVSKPGCRAYVPSDGLPRVLNGLGIAIISTSRGVVTDRQARELHVGGEVLCRIW